MKSKFYILIAAFLVLIVAKSKAQSNRELSNLTAPTAINQSLLPNARTIQDLGSATRSWRNIYFSEGVYIKGKPVIHAPDPGNFFTGPDAGRDTLTGGYNTGAGQFALGSITSGNSNTSMGFSSLFNTTSGRDNAANGYTSLYFNTTGSYNTATGSWALNKNTVGNNNTAFGYSALWQNTTGNDNAAIGKYAMYNNQTGYSNVALGTHALFKSVRRHHSVAIGDSALYHFIGQYSDESYNTAVGSKALYNATTGNDNTAIGRTALYNTTTGSANVAVGLSALYSNTEGVFNTAIGRTAMTGNTTGDYNTAVGFGTLDINKTGNQNTAVGSYAGPNTFDLISNSTSIGYLARATASNQVRIGNTLVTSIGGQVGWTTFSDGRYKRDIKEDVAGLAFINSLRPVSYTVDTKSLSAYLRKGMNNAGEEELNANKISADESSKILHDGFVAQEVEEAAKNLGFNFSGIDKPKTEDGLYGLRYDNFVVPLVKAVQELSKQNDSLQKQMNELKTLLLKNNFGDASSPGTVINAKITDASLEQNVPNPFSSSTSIRYSLPQKFSTAKIILTDINGKAIKQLNISGSGKGVVNIEASTLSAGIYQYLLIIDGVNISSKQMILTK